MIAVSRMGWVSAQAMGYEIITNKKLLKNTMEGDRKFDRDLDEKSSC